MSFTGSSWRHSDDTPGFSYAVFVDHERVCAWLMARQYDQHDRRRIAEQYAKAHGIGLKGVSVVKVSDRIGLMSKPEAWMRLA